MNSKGVFWGTVLILGGIFFFLKQSGLLFFHIDWLIWKKIWPLLLILAGIRLLLPKENKIIGILLLLTVVAIFAYSIYQGIQINRSFSHRGDLGSWFTPFPKRGEGDSKDNLDESNSDNADSSAKSPNPGNQVHQKFTVPLAKEISKVSLSVHGGNAEFTSDVTHSSIFEATTQIDESSAYRLERTTEGNREKINLLSNQHSGNLHFDSKNPLNSVNIRLNPDLIWDIDLGVGAGKVDYDFSGYKIENLNFQSGLSTVKLRVGRLNTATHINIESGLASFELMIPRASGCKVQMDVALNQKDLGGFQKVDDENYQTANYNTADRKITVHVSGGISQISIHSY